MNIFPFEHTAPNTNNSGDGYTPVISHQDQLYDKSAGGEFLDDAIRTHEQPLSNEKEEKVKHRLRYN